MISTKKTRFLYDILDVPQNANNDEIKKAFRQKSMIFHPDKNDGIEMDEFIEIKKAYDILMDDEKRKLYDETGYIEENIHDSLEVAIEVLQSWFRNFLGEEAFEKDILTVMKARAKSDVAQCQYKIRSVSKKIKNLEKIKSKLTKKNKKINVDFLKKVLDDEIANRNFEIQQSTFQIRTDETILEILEDYNYEIPEEFLDKIQSNNTISLGSIFGR